MLAVFRLAFTAYNAALGVVTDAELVADAPAEVREAVTYGRRRSTRTSPRSRSGRSSRS